eukprot:Tbor_TRINITY_DN4276_c0_g1::TRINITY_DN4276_c0_g1_i1::g.23880::m.23880
MITEILIAISSILIAILAIGVIYYCYRRKIYTRIIKFPNKGFRKSPKFRQQNICTFPDRRGSEEQDAYELRMQLEMRKRQKIAEDGTADTVSIDSCERYGGQEDKDIIGPFICVDATSNVHSRSPINGTISDRSGSPMFGNSRPYRLLTSPPQQHIVTADFSGRGFSDDDCPQSSEYSPVHSQSHSPHTHRQPISAMKERPPAQGVICSLDSSDVSDRERSNANISTEQGDVSFSITSSRNRHHLSSTHRSPTQRPSPSSSPLDNRLMAPPYPYKTLPPTPKQSSTSPFTNDCTDMSDLEEYFDGGKYSGNCGRSITSTYFTPSTAGRKVQGVWPHQNSNITDNNNKNMNYNAMGGLSPAIPVFMEEQKDASPRSIPATPYELSFAPHGLNKGQHLSIITDATLRDNNYFSEVLTAPVGLDDRGLSPKGVAARKGHFGGKRVLTAVPQRTDGFSMSQFDHN